MTSSLSLPGSVGFRYYCRADGQQRHRDRNWFGLFTLPLASAGVGVRTQALLPQAAPAASLFLSLIPPLRCVFQSCSFAQEECKRDLTCGPRGPEKWGRERGMQSPGLLSPDLVPLWWLCVFVLAYLLRVHCVSPSSTCE